MENMLTTGHCTVHPSREAQHRCRSCGCWLCDRCVRTTSQGVFCSGRCRRLFRLRSIGRSIRHFFTSPLEGPWVVGLVGGVVALVIWGVALLAAQLVEVSRPIPPQTPIQTFRLVESPGGLDVALEGTPGRHAIVIDTAGRSKTMTLDGEGKALLRGIHTSTRLQTEPPPPVEHQQTHTPSPSPAPTRIPPTPTATPPPTPTAPALSPTPPLRRRSCRRRLSTCRA